LENAGPTTNLKKATTYNKVVAISTDADDKKFDLILADSTSIMKASSAKRHFGIFNKAYSKASTVR